MLTKKALRAGRLLCLAALAGISLYAFARLYVMGQRADISILLINVPVFAAVAGVFIYLSKKERDLEEEEMFRD